MAMLSDIYHIKYKNSPVIIILMVIYYVLWYFMPKVLQIIGPIFVAFACLFMLVPQVVLLCFYQDERGNHIPYRKRIARFKEIHDTHDYFYVLHKHGIQAVRKFGIPIDADPQVIQKAMREKFSDTQPQTPINFRGQLLEEIQLKFYFKDGNPENQSPKNLGVRIYKPNGKKETLRALFIPVDPKCSKQEITIPINLVESYAEEFFRLLSGISQGHALAIFRWAVCIHDQGRRMYLSGWTRLLH